MTRGPRDAAIGMADARLVLHIPLITAQTAEGMRLRVNGTAALLLVVALPAVSWAVGLAAWFG